MIVYRLNHLQSVQIQVYVYFESLRYCLVHGMTEVQHDNFVVYMCVTIWI
jgi:hypothetical protein